MCHFGCILDTPSFSHGGAEMSQVPWIVLSESDQENEVFA